MITLLLSEALTRSYDLRWLVTSAELGQYLESASDSGIDYLSSIFQWDMQLAFAS